MHKKSFTPSTISTYLSAVSYVHKLLGLTDNTHSFLVNKLVTGSYRLSKTYDNRLPLTVPIINNLIDVIPQVLSTNYEQLLFKAIFLFAFSAFARIGELVLTTTQPNENILLVDDVKFSITNKTAQEVIVCFRNFKHNVKGQSKTISFSHGRTQISPVKTLVSYLCIRPKGQGPLFCMTNGKPIHRIYFDKILHKCLNKCNLDGSRYKGHSFRIGAATDAAERGLSDAQIRNLGRWKSNAFQKYIRSQSM